MSQLHTRGPVRELQVAVDPKGPPPVHCWCQARLCIEESLGPCRRMGSVYHVPILALGGLFSRAPSSLPPVAAGSGKWHIWKSREVLYLLPFTYCLLRFFYRYFIALFLLIKYILYGKVNFTSSKSCQVRSEKPSVSHNQLSRCHIAGETRPDCWVFLPSHLLSAARSTVGCKAQFCALTKTRLCLLRVFFFFHVQQLPWQMNILADCSKP